MEQNQPLKKRAVAQPPPKTYARSFTPQTQPQPETQQPAESIQQPIQVVSQIIHCEYYDPPMSINSWTQTNSDEFPENPPLEVSETEAPLLARIRELKEIIIAKSKELQDLQNKGNGNTSPERTVSNATTSPSPIKLESRTYRILTQSESNSETQIELELHEDEETENIDISSSTSPLNASPPLMVKQIYGQEDIQSIPKIPKTTPKTQTKQIIGPEKTKGDIVFFGPNNTKVPREEFQKICWTAASIATRKLLTLIFDRKTLATHSMTGKQSPAFKNLPIKKQLDPKAVDDIIFIVSEKCEVSAKEVRAAITTKCADENKMAKLQNLKDLGLSQLKRSPLREINIMKNDDKENS